MQIFLNLRPLQEFFMQSPDQALFKLELYYFWLFLGIMYLAGVRTLWLIYIRKKFGAKIKYVYLALDVPRANIQTPRAVENLFTYLGGAHGTMSFFDTWWEGKWQIYFSFEIVSIGGHTQFVVRTPAEFRYLVETAVYSQYPDAEITEIDDYTKGIPTKYPNEEYDVAGGEYIHQQNHMFPIKTYEEFEHNMGPSETQFKDPMASLMDLFSSLRPGEQAWYQIIIIPTGFDWMAEADEQVAKIRGIKPTVSFWNNFIDILGEWISDLSEIVITLWSDIEAKPEKEFKPLSMIELTPKLKKQVEGLHKKISKLGFEAKIRFVYVARKEVFDSKKVANGFVGFIKQFIALDLNSFKPDLKHTYTTANYFSRIKRIEQKKSNLVHNYINREDGAGMSPKILNVEELATIWHFPIEDSVKAPLIQKTPAKKSKPPMTLPTDEGLVESMDLEPLTALDENWTPAATSASKKMSDNDDSGQAPSNLPFG